MNNSLFFFFSFLCCRTIITQISVYLKKYTSSIEMGMGTPQQSINTHLYFSSCVSYISDSSISPVFTNFYRTGNSKTFQLKGKDEYQYTYSYHNLTINGLLGEDIVSINNKKIGTINFIYVSSQYPDSQIEAILGLCNEPPESDVKFSLIEKMNIEHKIIVIRENEISFGIIPQEILHDYSNFAYCDLFYYDGVKKYNPQWVCTVNSISVGEKYPIESKIVFENGLAKTTAPLEILLFLEKNYFSELISSHECNFGYINSYYIFTCKNNNYILPDFKFEIGNWEITIPKEQLFEYNEKNEEYEFIIYGKESFSFFIFGRNLLHIFTTILDKDNKIAGLYSKNGIKYIGKEKLSPFYQGRKLKKTNKSLNVFYMLSIMILLMGIIMIMIEKRLSLKKERRNNRLYKILD